MYKDLSSGIKSSITRSISTALEQYMAKISWNEELFSVEDFIRSWRAYISENAAWFEKVSDDVKESLEFHEEIAKKMNATMEKMLAEPVPDELATTIENMQQTLKTQYKYGCKAEALYVENVLKEMQKQA